MARSTTKKSTDKNEEAVPVADQDTQVIEADEVEDTDLEDDTDDESTGEAEAADEAAEEAAIEAEVEAFVTIMEAALGAATQDGTVPDELTENLVTAYREMSGGKPKARARLKLNDAMKSAMVSEEYNKARAAMSLGDTVKSSPGSSGNGRTKAPADPTEAFLDQIVGVRLALDYLGSNVPEGVAEDWKGRAQKMSSELASQVEAYFTWEDNGAVEDDEPDLSQAASQAVRAIKGRRVRKVSSGGGRVGPVYSGPTRSIKKHVSEAFAKQPIGTFLKIAEIKAFRSAEYGDDSPSPGAISAALKSSNWDAKALGLEPTERDGKKGVVKTA